MLLGQKINDRVAEMRNLPKGIDQRSACRHPDWTGPDDLAIKILELREITDWQKPIYVKIGGSRPFHDTALAVKAGADVIVLDGMQGGTAATQDVFIEHVGHAHTRLHPAPQFRRLDGTRTCIARCNSCYLGRHPQRS
jgi:glutamate synthase domain-containing protein 2